jgi:hypothetical protein
MKCEPKPDDDPAKIQRLKPDPSRSERGEARCPAAILDTAPGGGGLGVWTLKGTDADGNCVYTYGGGIA